MNDPSPGEPVAVNAGDLQFVAGQATEVADLLEETAAVLRDPTATAANGLPEWQSAGVVLALDTQWTHKTKALTTGTNGLRDFSANLSQFVQAVGATDVAAAANINEQFGNDYVPTAAPTPREPG